MRVKVIYNSIKHGLLPWQLYEKEKHYNCSYWQHLWINIQYSWRWITFKELQSDIDFETKNN